MKIQPSVVSDALSEIAIIEPLGGHAGMNYYNIELARGLYQSGVHTRLYTCDETIDVSEPGIKILKPFKGLYVGRFKAWRGLKFLAGLSWAAYDAKRLNVRIAHLHYFQYGLRELACCITLKVLGMKIVATIHDITPFSRPEGINTFRTIIRLTDQVIVHNKFSAKILAREVGTKFAMPPVSVVSIGNFLGSVKLIDRFEARRVLSLPPDEPILLFFGQIKPEKGLEDLLHAFANHKREGGKGFLVVAGRPMSHAKENYVKMAADLRLSSHVRFVLKYIPDKEASTYYCAADLVVLPYREIYQSAVLLMAMSYSRAVLAPDLPPMVEVVKDGMTGLLFSSADVKSLTTALGRAVTDTAKLNELGYNAAVDMDKNYGWNNVGRSTATVYLKALRR